MPSRAEPSNGPSVPAVTREGAISSEKERASGDDDSTSLPKGEDRCRISNSNGKPTVSRTSARPERDNSAGTLYPLVRTDNPKDDDNGGRSPDALVGPDKPVDLSKLNLPCCDCTRLGKCVRKDTPLQKGCICVNLG